MANQLLLVDDSPLIHRVVELTFEGQDFSIHAADTPEQAFALARTLKPDIVVASAEMKGAGGADICRRLRQEGELGETPVLLLTSAKARMSEGEARQAGAAGVLVKPFEPERLLAEVGRALTRGASVPDAGAVAATPAAGVPPEQEEPSGGDLFEDHELESLFSGGQESPAELPPHVQDDSALLLQAEKVLDDAGPADAPAPPASVPGQPDVRLFDDSELDDLFADEIEEKAPPTGSAPAAPAAQETEDEWADLELETDIVARGPAPRGDLADLAHEQASAAEAQLAELEAEFASGEAPTEEDMQAAESRIENLQEELSRDLAGAGDLQLPKQPKREAAPPVRTATDDDLLNLAVEAGFSGPGRAEPETVLDSGDGDELDLEAELAAAGVADSEENPSAPPGSKANLAIDDLVEAGYSLPTDEPGDDTPVWDIPLKQGSAPAAKEPAGEADAVPEGDMEPLVKQSLERTVEAIVPALIRNIEALVVRQLPDLVEKIVLREIEKIKRGE